MHAAKLPDLTGLGARLRHLRELAGLTYRELAALAGVCHTTLVSIESGRSLTPRVDVILGLARVLGTTAEWLGTGDGLAPSATRVRRALAEAMGITGAK